MLEQVTLTLQDLPEKPKEVWSLREAIALLYEPITAALDRGYSYEEVTSLLSKEGIDVSTSSMKRYLSTARKDKEGGSKPRTRRVRRTAAKAVTPGQVSSALGAVSGTNGQAPAAEAEAAPTRKRRTRAAAPEEAKPAEAKPAKRGRAAKVAAPAEESSTKTAAKAKTKPTSRAKAPARTAKRTRKSST